MPATKTLSAPSILNDDQTRVFKGIWKSMVEGPYDMLSMLGPAGVGKTFLLAHLHKRLKEEGKKPILLAPTHQSAACLEDIHDGDITASTIHSALGLQLERDGKGGYQLTVDEDARSIEQYDIALGDEASMYGRDLWPHIEGAVHGSGLDWLNVGDSFQLPPVNEDPSPALEQNGFRLEEIVRQAEGSDIIELATYVREQMKHGRQASLLEAAPTGGEVQVMETPEALDFAEEKLEEAPRETRVLAFRNKTANRWAANLKKRLYPDTDTFAEGMWLLAREPYAPGGQDADVRFHTSERLQVKRAEKTTEHFSHREIPVWKLKLKRDTNGSYVYDVLVPRGEGKQTFSDLVEKHKDRGNWKEFYECTEKIARVQSAVSSTTHKSQGSTIKNVVVDVNDLDSAPDRSIRNPLKYVAVTRASEQLVLAK